MRRSPTVGPSDQPTDSAGRSVVCGLQPGPRPRAGQGPSRVGCLVGDLKLTRGTLVTVLPMTTVEKPWRHRLPVAAGGWVITEQVRTVPAQRFRRPAPDIALTDHELSQVSAILARMLML